MRALPYVFAGVVLALTSTGCAETRDARVSGSATAEKSGVQPNGSLVFARGRPHGKWRLQVLPLHHARPEPFSPLVFDHSGVALSPTGLRIAFSRPRDGIRRNDDLYVARRDGGGLRRLTRMKGAEFPVAWSPRGGTVLYVRFWGVEAEDAHLVSARGTVRRRLGLDWGSWSPDGARIVGTRGTAIGAGDVYLLELASGKRTRLTSEEGNEWGAEFTARGEISFITNAREAPYGHELWLMRADGSERRPLARTIRGHFWQVVWSPDGSRVALAAIFGDDDTSRLVVLPAESRTVVIGPSDGVSGRFPAWSPDGRKIAFTRGRFPRGDVWVMNQDGSGRRRITHSRPIEYAVAWLRARR